MWNCPIRISAAAGNPTRPIWTSCLSPFKAVCLKSREQYTDFYRDKERWRYLKKLDTKNSLLSLDGFTDSEGKPLDFIADEAADIAETVVNAVMVDRLKAALPLLSDSEQELIQAIFFDGLSEREVGARFGITQSVVNKRKARILRKLRKIIEN